MATTETIGSAGRDRTTPQTWFNAQPATLTDDRIGECYNDSEFTTASVYTFSGITPGSFSLTLKCATGQSFKDNASVRSNALKYNASNGVGIRQTSGYTSGITGSQTKIHFQGLQIKNDGTGGAASDAVNLSGSGSFTDCLIHASWTLGMGLSGSFPSSNLVVFMTHTAGTGIVSQSSVTFRHVTIVRSSDVTAAGTGFASQYSTNTLINCAIFGFSTPTSGSYSGSSNNASDGTGLPGTSNQESVTYSQATPFTDADKDSLDLRSIASTSLAANGVYDASYATDISGYTRANPPTIGHWEITAGGGGGGTANPWYYYAQQ